VSQFAGGVDWKVSRRRGGGAAGAARGSRSRKDKLPAAVTEKIVELKQANPAFGAKRIAQFLRRLFLLPASAETVRARLHREGLMPPTKPPRPKNLTRPRFFERAPPTRCGSRTSSPSGWAAVTPT